MTMHRFKKLHINADALSRSIPTTNINVIKRKKYLLILDLNEIRKAQTMDEECQKLKIAQKL